MNFFKTLIKSSNKHEHKEEDVATCSCCSCIDTEDFFDDSEKDEESEVQEFRREIRFLIIVGVIFALCLIIEEFFHQYLNPFVLKAAFFSLYIVCGLPILKMGLKSVEKLDFFNEFTLMGGASIAAVAIGQMSEAVGVMIFYRLGEAFQKKASSHSRRSIKALLAQKPLLANLLKDGKVEVINPKDIVKGDIVQVLPGEIIPIDGIIVSGTSQINTSAITGESKPVFAKVGSAVHGGTLSLNGLLTIEAAGPFEDSTISRMLEMVQNAVAHKSPTERFITRFAKWYTPAVFTLATLVTVIPPLLGYGDFRDWLYRGLVLLVISCPCALVISIPLGYFGGIGSASKKGILVKGANGFDSVEKVDTVVFDKTGTLTYGDFRVVKVSPVNKITEKELLEMAAVAETGSNHPLAKSILAAAGSVTIPQNVQITQIAGKGMLVESDETSILVGNQALLEDNGVTTDTASEAGTVVHVAKNKKYQGYILIADSVRKESYQAVTELRKLGIKKIYMLTGDNEDVARSVSDELKLDGYRSNLLPDDKVRELKNFCGGDTSNTVFVGDGINDGPVLVTSQTGVAMGGFGSQVAVEVADVVILDDSPLKVSEFLRVAKKTRIIVWQNVLMALSIKGIFLIFGIAGIAGLWEAVFADVGVALLAILNSTRTSKV